MRSGSEAPRRAAVGWIALVVAVVAACAAGIGPDGRDRVLVVLPSRADEAQFGAVLRELRAHGYDVQVHAAASKTARLRDKGEYTCDVLMLLSPTASGGLGADLTSDEVLGFLDSGGSLLVVADVGYSKVVSKIVGGIGVELDAADCSVIDHGAVVDELDQGSHTFVRAGGCVSAGPIVSGSEALDCAGIAFRGVGAALHAGNELVESVAWGSPSAFSFQAKDGISEVPMATGKDVVLAAVLQTRSGGRAVYIGGLAPLRDEVMSDARLGADHARFVKSLFTWVCGERGVLRAENARHSQYPQGEVMPVYRVTDTVAFSVDVHEWDGALRSWVPFQADDMQVELTMLDPYVRARLRPDGNGTMSVVVTLPDVIGIYKFAVDYVRTGFSHVRLTVNLNVRPFWHNEFERFIPQAFPYYTSAFCMLIGALLFGFVLLFGSASVSADKPRDLSSRPTAAKIE